ncbi:MAG: (2Fe-2S)-binding protein [Ruminococcus sp.]|nr:(2Fe-2S)-binding protein [Ruminococcus sp.]
MKENYTVCNCMQVSYADIANALETHNKFDNVLSAFDDVQNQTHCSTGCGGCHQKVLDIISEIMMSK